VYTVYKKDGDAYSLVGFVTAYQFYAYPDKIRYRISQFFIVPPCQRQGHGQALYEMVYERRVADANVVEVTVEDPNDDFQGMRDVCDVKRLISKGAFEGMSGSVEGGVMETYRKEFKLNKVRRDTYCVETNAAMRRDCNVE
jgi:histone acetyltransferase 1